MDIEEKDGVIVGNNKNNIINFNKENTTIFSEKANIKAKGIRVNLVRKSVNLNLKEFGELCKVESGMLGRYERGSTAIHITCIFRICISLRDKFNLFVDPEWIENGSGYGPHIINEDTMIYLKDIDDLIRQYTNCYGDAKETLNTYKNDNKNTIFSGQYLTIGKKVNVNNPKELSELDYVECDVTLNKPLESFDNKQNFIAKVSYDEESDRFILNNKYHKTSPIAIQKKDIVNIKILNGFAAYEGNLNLNKLIA